MTNFRNSKICVTVMNSEIRTSVESIEIMTYFWNNEFRTNEVIEIINFIVHIDRIKFINELALNLIIPGDTCESPTSSTRVFVTVPEKGDPSVAGVITGVLSLVVILVVVLLILYYKWVLCTNSFNYDIALKTRTVLQVGALYQII